MLRRNQFKVSLTTSGSDLGIIFEVSSLIDDRFLATKQSTA